MASSNGKAIVLCLILCTSSAHYCCEAVKFALCPKSIDNPFFGVSRDGCIDRAKSLSSVGEDEVECLYVGPSSFDPDGKEQAAMVESILDDIDGLSISVTNPEAMRPVIQKALAMGIPVVTYDSDDPESGRASYIGTDNFFLGQQLGKVLKQLEPTGGTYAIVSDDSPNLIEREKGVRDSLTEADGWYEVSVSPSYMQGNASLAIDLMRELMGTIPDLTAIVPVLGAPMFLPEKWSQLVADHPDTTFVVGDDLAVQLDFLSRGKVQGLVGQLPYEMGARSVDSLLQLAKNPDFELADFQGTNVLEHLKIPLVLPELIVADHYLGNLSILGFSLFAVIAATAISFASWAIINRGVRVVKVAQPEFLVMVAGGTLVMGSAIIPLSFDDSSSSSYTEAKGEAICMSVPWLVFLGFTITISALFAKTWRVNRLFHASSQFRRGQVTSREVFLPCVILMACNVIVLLTWTILDPMYYVRKDDEGTDAWNRIIATYGTCVADEPLPYVLPLAILNLGILVVANYEAYRARNIQGEFSESRYIGYAMIAMLQATMIGAPLLVLVKEMPEAWYLTMCFMLFMICMVILCIIFVPKVYFAYKFKQRSSGSQQQMIRNYIHDTQEAIKKEKTPTPLFSTVVSTIPTSGGKKHSEDGPHNKSMMSDKDNPQCLYDTEGAMEEERSDGALSTTNIQEQEEGRKSPLP